MLERLSQAAQHELTNIVTLLLGITIGASMGGKDFLQWNTVLILVIGFLAFVFDTAGGVLFAKFVNLFLKKKVNPMIGAAGISHRTEDGAEGRPLELYTDAGDRRERVRSDRLHHRRRGADLTAFIGGNDNVCW